MKIKVCIGSSCHLKGSRIIVERLADLIQSRNLKDSIELSGTFCMAKCQDGVCVSVDDVLHSVKPETVESFFEKVIL